MGLILGWKGYIHSPKAKNKMLIILCVQSDRFCSQDILLKKREYFKNVMAVMVSVYSGSANLITIVVHLLLPSTFYKQYREKGMHIR